MKDTPQKRTRPSVISTAVILVPFFLFLMATDTMASDLNPKQVESTVEKSIKGLLLGEEFSPAMRQKQKALRNMFESGALKKEKVANIIKKAVVPILNESKTSRYVLQQVPGRCRKLLSPYLDWKDVREIVWEACSAVIEEDEKLVLKIATLAPEGTPWVSVPKSMLIPEVKELSGGKVVIKIYSGGVMGEDTDILRKMDIGQLDGCGCTALGVLKASPEASVFLMPGLFRNYEEVDYILKKFRKRMDKAFEKRGYILAAMIDTGMFYVFSKNKITSLEEIRHRKMLTWFGNVETTLFDELGINATPVAVPEIVSAMSTGMADTNLSPAAWMLGMQAYQYANYFLKAPWVYSPAAVVVSKNTQERLRKQMGVSKTFAGNITELLVFEVNRLEEEWKQRARAYERKSLEAFQKKCGMEAIKLPAEDKKKIEQAFEKVRKKLAGKAYPEKLMNDVLQALKQYRKKH